MSECEVSGDVSKRMSPEDRRLTEKPNGVVWRVKTKSEVGSERKWFPGPVWWFTGEFSLFSGSQQ